MPGRTWRDNGHKGLMPVIIIALDAPGLITPAAISEQRNTAHWKIGWRHARLICHHLVAQRASHFSC